MVTVVILKKMKQWLTRDKKREKDNNERNNNWKRVEKMIN